MMGVLPAAVISGLLFAAVLSPQQPERQSCQVSPLVSAAAPPDPGQDPIGSDGPTQLVRQR